MCDLNIEQVKQTALMSLRYLEEQKANAVQYAPFSVDGLMATFETVLMLCRFIEDIEDIEDIGAIAESGRSEADRIIG